MEKRLLLFLILSFAILFAWSSVFAPKPSEEGGDDAKGTEAPESPGGAGPAEPVAPGTAEPGETPGVLPPEPAAESGLTTSAPHAKNEVIDGRRVKWTLNRWGATVRFAHLKEFAKEPNQDLAEEENWYQVLTGRADEHDHLSRDKRIKRWSLALQVLDPEGDVRLTVDRVQWDLVVSAKDRVVYRLEVPEAGVTLEKEYTFPTDAEGIEGGAYHLVMALRIIVNDAGKAKLFGTEAWRIRLYGAGGVNTEFFSSSTPAYAAVNDTDLVQFDEFAANPKWRDLGDTGTWISWPKNDDDFDEGQFVEWAGVHSSFFGAILWPENPKELACRKARFFPVKDKHDLDVLGGKAEFASYAAALEFDVDPYGPSGRVERKFRFYVGPMDPDVVGEGFYSRLGSVIDYGLFSFIVKALVFFLGIIKSVVSSWGLAIVILTLMIRMAMFPLSRKSQVAMQKYQRQIAKLKPKLDQLRQKHASNRKKLNEETMKLYREEGVRVFPAGCLIMFLQLPIFIGLFQALRYSIGLRHSQFLWAVDLTAPDRLAGPWDLSSIPMIVPDILYLNIFPILMAVTWFLSSAMAPKPTDPQQAQTMKMMKWMPIIFSVLLYNYAAGLALYMVVSSSWSIFESKVVKKIFIKEDAPATVVSPTFRKGK